MTELLTPSFGEGSRVIFLSSAAHKLSKQLNLSLLSETNIKPTNGSERFMSYANSKLCLLLYSKSLAHYMKGIVVAGFYLFFDLIKYYFFMLQIRKLTCIALILEALKLQFIDIFLFCKIPF